MREKWLTISINNVQINELALARFNKVFVAHLVDPYFSHTAADIFLPCIFMAQLFESLFASVMEIL